jgi:hypothetical protein
MKNMITKELLSDILCQKVINIRNNREDKKWNRIKITYIDDNDLKHEDGYINTSFYINIHELAYKCKEWALANSNYTSFCTQFEKYQFSCYLYKFINIFAEKQTTYTFRADTEPEAIFNACQWILENKE